eukprot:336365-Prorocentrum_minimum.AAC.2
MIRSGVALLCWAATHLAESGRSADLAPADLPESGRSRLLDLAASARESADLAEAGRDAADLAEGGREGSESESLSRAEDPLEGSKSCASTSALPCATKEPCFEVACRVVGGTGRTLTHEIKCMNNKHA